MGNHVRYLTGALGKQTRPKIIELRQLTITQRQQPILRNITLEVFEGEAVALLGSSENEKNTLLACLLGQIQPTGGEIRLLDTMLPPLTPEIRRQIGMMPQQIDRATGETVADYLQRFAAYHGVRLTSAQLSVYSTPYQIELATPVAEMTRLQARVLALALALVHDPRLALLVEPLAGLEESEQVVIQNHIQRIQREGRTLLCTFAPPLAEKHFTGYDLVVELEQGRLRRQEH